MFTDRENIPNLAVGQIYRLFDSSSIVEISSVGSDKFSGNITGKGAGNGFWFHKNGVFGSREDTPTFERHVAYPYILVNNKNEVLNSAPKEPEQDIWSII